MTLILKLDLDMVHMYLYTKNDVPNQWWIQDFPEEGAPTYDFVNFCRKLHENEEILAAGGGGEVTGTRDPS